MQINFYRWRDTDAATRAKIMRRAEADISAIAEKVAPIIEDVRVSGDEALIRYARQFDGAALSSVRVTEEEFVRACAGVPDELKQAIDRCAANVRRFHEEQMRCVERQWEIEIEPGVIAGERVSPIPSVGLYVPRGKGAFPSAMYMLCLPAVIAGVQQIAVVTPPTPDGSTDAAALYTAQMCGVRDVFKAGGAQGIAALAYGTQSVPKVAKVLGPGSPYVAAAKRLLADVIDPGMPAGPSEAIILCDGSADPENTLRDILNEAEHGADSAGLLVTHDEALANFAARELPRVIAALPQPHRDICEAVMSGYGGIILTESLEESVAFANDYAPEHLVLKVADRDAVLPLLQHAGEILIGEQTPSTLGNYGIGVNHVLPTGGHARTCSATGVWDFLKRTSLARVDARGLAALSPAVSTLATYEGFPAHVRALERG